MSTLLHNHVFKHAILLSKERMKIFVLEREGGGVQQSAPPVILTGDTCHEFSPVILLVKSPVMAITSPLCVLYYLKTPFHVNQDRAVLRPQGLVSPFQCGLWALFYFA